MVKPIITFAPLDYVVLALFLIGIFALGFSAKLKSNSVLQFLAAGRQLSLPLFVASLVSLWYGGVLGIGESVSAYGVGTWILFGVPYYVFAIFYALVLSKRVRSADQISIPERLQLRYGKKVALLSAGLIFLLGVPAAHVLMLGTLLQSFSGWEPYVCVPVATLVGASFLYKGGLLADARVSLLAFAMMYIGFGAMAVWCLTHYPLLPTLHLMPDKTKLSWDGGTGILFVISMFLVAAWTLIDPGFHQRVASSATPSIARRGVLICTFFWFLFDILSITVALYAISLNPKAAGLQVFPAFAQMTLPPGLKAIFFCGMFGTIVSAMVGYSLVSGATIGREIVARLKPDLSDPQINLSTRVGIAIACVVAIVLALQIHSVVDLWTSWSGAVVGALLIPVLFAYRSRTKANPFMVWSMSSGFAVAIAWMIYGRSNGNPYLGVVWQRTSQGLRIVMDNSEGSIPGIKMAIGTLMPGLLMSAVVVGLGTVFSHKGRQDA